jgi:hypothetical protein
MSTDEFDQPYMTAMDIAKAKAAQRNAEAERGPEPPAREPRRPQPMLNTTTISGGTLGAFAIGAIALIAIGASWLGGPAPEQARPTAVPAFVAPPPAEVQSAPQEQPTAAPAVEEPAPVPTGFIEPIGQPQQAPAPPAQPVYVAPPVPAPVLSDLVPIQPTAPIDCASRGIGPCRGARP